MTNSTKRQTAKAATRAKVLEAAKTCFGTLGYERATIRDIANNSRMSTGAIFANFADKAELYREVFGHPPISPEVGRELLKALRIAGNALGQSAQFVGRRGHHSAAGKLQAAADDTYAAIARASTPQHPDHASMSERAA